MMIDHGRLHHLCTWCVRGSLSRAASGGPCRRVTLEEAAAQDAIAMTLPLLRPRLPFLSLVGPPVIMYTYGVVEDGVGSCGAPFCVPGEVCRMLEFRVPEVFMQEWGALGTRHAVA
eukprot:1142772-Amphidinium_carterae.2